MIAIDDSGLNIVKTLQRQRWSDVKLDVEMAGGAGCCSSRRRRRRHVIPIHVAFLYKGVTVHFFFFRALRAIVLNAICPKSHTASSIADACFTYCRPPDRLRDTFPQGLDQRAAAQAASSRASGSLWP